MSFPRRTKTAHVGDVSTAMAMWDKYHRLAYDRASSFARTTGHDLDDLKSVVRAEFMRALMTWEPSRGAFTTHLYRLCNNALISYTQRHGVNRMSEEQQERALESLADNTTPDLVMSLRDTMAGLSREALDVVNTILAAPDEFLREDRCNRAHVAKHAPRAQERVYRAMMGKGMTRRAACAVMSELRAAFS